VWADDGADAFVDNGLFAVDGAGASFV